MIFRKYDTRVVNKIYTHIFRRSKAKQMEADGFKLSEIQKKLRHKSITTTIRYLEADLEDIVSKEIDVYG